MTTQMKPDTTTHMVKTMRQIRDEISNEIKDMTFEEERAYLNQLLACKASGKASAQQQLSKSRGEE